MLHELLALIFSHIRGMWRFRWYAIVLAWLVSMAGWAYISTIPDTYKSTARLQIDTESMLEPLLQGLAIQTDMRTRVDAMTRTLLTRPKLEKVARQTDLDLQVNTPGQMNSLISRLQTNTNIGSSRRDQNIYTISHTSSNPNSAQQVVQAFIDVFVEETLGENRVDNTSAQEFLEGQISEYEKRLVTAEQKLVEFKKQNVGRMPGQSGGFYVQLQGALGQLDGLRTALQISKSRRDELERQLQGEKSVIGAPVPLSQQPGNNVTAAIDIKIAASYSTLEALTLRFTDKHPDIQATKETIAQLEKRRDDELARLQQQQSSLGSPSVDLQSNPIYQSIKIAFNQAEIEVAGLRVEVLSKQREIAELKKMVDIIPQVEANLARLNRDYQVTKQQYDVLLQRLETARLSQQAEQSGENIEFQVIDPPTLPRKPIGPLRRLLNSVTVAAALVLGVALTFALHQLYPVYGDSRTLGNSIEYPVLGVVSLKRDRAQKVRSGFGRLAVVSAALLLLVVAGSVITYEEVVRNAFQSIMRLI